MIRCLGTRASFLATLPGLDFQNLDVNSEFRAMDTAETPTSEFVDWTDSGLSRNELKVGRNIRF